MRNYFCLLILTLSLNPLKASEIPEIKTGPAWQKILNNDFNLKSKELPENPDELYACFCAAKMRADYETAFEAIIKLLDIKKQSPESMACFRQAIKISENLSKTEKLAIALEKLFTNQDIYPDLKNAVQKKLISLSIQMRDSKKLKKFIKTDSALRLWAITTGPFRSRKPYQLDRAEIFEANPAKAAFKDNLEREVTVLHDTETDYNGFLNTADNIYSRISGSVYATAFLKSKTDCDAVLSVINFSSLKIWLNSIPVYRPIEKRDYRTSRKLLKIKLHKGLNCLVVKTAFNRAFAIQVLSPDLSLNADVKAVTWQDGKSCLKPLKHIYGFINSTILPEPEISYYKDSTEKSSFSKLLMMLDAWEYAANIQELRSFHKKLAAAYPESLFIKEENLIFYHRESYFGIDSKERLQKEAFSEGKKITQLKADLPRTNFMQAIYLKNHNEIEEALKSIRKASAAAPHWASAFTEQAQLENKLGLLLQAEKSFKKAVTLGDSSAYFQLGNLLIKKHRLKEAFEYYDLAWKNYELNSRLYLNKAISATDWNLVKKLLTQYEKFHTGNDRSLLFLKANISKAKGNFKEALKFLSKAEEKYPEDSFPCIRKAEIYLSLNEKDKALSSFSLAQKRNIQAGSADLQLRKRIRSLTGKNWLNKKFSIKPNLKAVEKYSAKNYPAASYATLLNSVVCRVFSDYSSEKVTHSAVKVITKSGIGKLSELKLPSNPDDLLMCRTILPDGSVFTPTNIRKLDFQKAASMYNVVPGAVLEYSYRSSSAGGLLSSFADNFYFEELYNPAEHLRYVLIIPEELQDKVSAETLPVDFKPEIKREGKNIIYVWEKKNVLGIKPEPGMPSRDKVLSNIKLQVRNKKFPADHRIFATPEKVHTDENITAKAKELTAGIKDTYKKVKIIHHYIRSSLTPAKEGKTARDAFYMGSGSETTAMKLMQAMLEATGIEYRKALVNQYYEDFSSEPDTRGTLAGYFYTPLLIAKGNNGENIWLRLISNSSMPMRHFRPNDLGQDIFGSPAITFGKDGAINFCRVYEKIAEIRPVLDDITFKIKENGNAAAAGQVLFAGAAAGQLRAIADLPQQGRRRIESVITMSYPRLVIEKSNYQIPDKNYSGKPEMSTEDFIFSFSGHIKDFCRHEKEKLTCDAFPYKFRIFQNLLAEKERKLNFNLGTDIEIQQNCQLSAPEGWVFTDIPQSIWWQSDFGLYVANFTVTGNKLKVSRFLLLPARMIKAHNYKYFADFIEECRRTEKSSVTLEKFTDSNITKVTENRSGKAIDLSRFYPQYPIEQKK